MVTITVDSVDSYKELDNGTIELGAPFRRINPNALRPNPPKFFIYAGLHKFEDIWDPYSWLNSLNVYINKQSALKRISMKEVINSDIVCRRGVLKSITCSSRKTIFAAIRIDGVIWIDCREGKSDKEEEHLKRRKSLYKGLRNEQYICLDHNGNKHDWKIQPSLGIEDKIVLRAKIKNGDSTIRVFYSAQLDCVDENSEKCELKCTNSHRTDKYFLNKHCLEGFMQCHLANIPNIIFSHETKGSITKIEKIKVADIPNLEGITWNLENKIDVLHTFLKRIMIDLPSDGNSMKITVEDGVAKYQQMPDWHYKFFLKILKRGATN